MPISDIVRAIVRKTKRSEGLNIVPFIDVMLVLLAIVLSVSTFIAQGQIKIDVPHSSAKPLDKQQKLYILIDSKNQIYVDDKPIGIDELKLRLEKLDSKVLVILRSDKDSKFEAFVKVLEILQEKSHENFAIETQRN